MVTAALGGAAVGAACGRQADRGADTAGATGAANARADSARAGDSGGAVAARPIGVQLYTLRTLMERNVENTLASVADIGYREVEFAGYFGREPRQLRATLDRLGLTAPSAHVPIADLRKNLAGVLGAAETLGHRYVVCPFIDEKERTTAGYRKIAGEFNRWGQACRDRGLRFAYHNHDFEFKATDGKVPYDALLQETDPKLVPMELDLFWITKAGRDPLEYFEKHRGRFPLLHVKDMRGVRGAQEMTAVGEGDIDFRRIFARAEQAGVEHYFVEYDNPTDPLASARTSFTNLRKLLA